MAASSKFIVINSKLSSTEMAAPTYSSHITNTPTKELDTGSLPSSDVVPLAAEKPLTAATLVATGIPPKNWGIVEPDRIYRSSFPKSENLEYLKTVGLKTILTLVETPLSTEYTSFIAENGIKHITIPIATNKDSAANIEPATMNQAISAISNELDYPILVHCNQGKHRTGCVVACYRKVMHWGLPDVLNEYHHHAGDKARFWDEIYIRDFFVVTPPSSDFDVSVECSFPEEYESIDTTLLLLKEAKHKVVDEWRHGLQKVEPLVSELAFLQLN